MESREKIDAMKRVLIILISIILLGQYGCCYSESELLIEQSKVISKSDYHIIVEPELAMYYYEIYDSKGIVLESSHIRRMPPIIEKNGNILSIKINYGTGIYEYHFANIENGLISNKYQYVVTYDSGKVVYIEGTQLENRKLVVHDIFDSSVGYTSISLDFSPDPNPVILAELKDDGDTIYISYYSGLSREIKNEIISIAGHSTGDGLREPS